MSLLQNIIPSSWKCSEIIPIPKKPKIKEMNDLRPVALTSIIMKCMERIVLNKIKSCFSSQQDPLQFAYRSKRSVDDAILIFTNNIYKHIDTPRNYCRTLFVDFSSAFNTIQPHILASKLVNLNLNKKLILWIIDFLTHRCQYVKLNNVQSKIIYTNTGAPQGCVISPVLFTIYTNDCFKNDDYVKLLKFADDSTIQGLITDNDELYRKYVDSFTDWCDQHFLLLNVKKTKEMIFDFRIKKDPILPLTIKNETVEIVKSYKYLGVTIDDKLEWTLHINNVHKKINQRLFFLRKLYSFKLNNRILQLFYKSCIESIILFCVCAWGGNGKVQNKTRINRVIKKACKITHFPFPYTDEILTNACIKKLKSILEDNSHPLHADLQFSARSGRLIYLKTNRERYKNSFMPLSVKLLTQQDK